MLYNDGVLKRSTVKKMLFVAEEVFIVSLRTTLYFGPFRFDLGRESLVGSNRLWDQTTIGVRTMMLRDSDGQFHPIGGKGLIGPQKIRKESNRSKGIISMRKTSHGDASD